MTPRTPGPARGGAAAASCAHGKRNRRGLGPGRRCAARIASGADRGAGAVAADLGAGRRLAAGLPDVGAGAVQADAAAGGHPAVDHRDTAAVDGGSGRHRGTRSAAQCPRHQPGRGRGRRSGRQSHTAGIQRAQRLLPRRHARLRQLLSRSVQPERDRGTEGPGLDPVRSWFHRRRDQPGQQAAAARADHGGHGDGRHRSDVPLHHRYRPAHRGPAELGVPPQPDGQPQWHVGARRRRVPSLRHRPVGRLRHRHRHAADPQLLPPAGRQRSGLRAAMVFRLARAGGAAQFLRLPQRRLPAHPGRYRHRQVRA